MKVYSVNARVAKIQPLTDSILQLFLDPENYIDYQAGQYLQIEHDGEALCYSVANAPLGAKQYELHIRHAADNLLNQSLIKAIKAKGALNIRLPFGDCHLNNLDKDLPIIFIAGGTGFAPVKAMIEQLLADGDPRPFEFYWGARSESDLYMDDKVNYWQQHVAHFNYFSCISGGARSSLAKEVLHRHAEDIQDWQVVISGPFDMVFNTRDILCSRGIAEKNLYSDAFSFEQNKDKS
jgi:CDP-4-dehydro-6-deoxyglucose reductase